MAPTFQLTGRQDGTCTVLPGHNRRHPGLREHELWRGTAWRVAKIRLAVILVEDEATGLCPRAPEDSLPVSTPAISNSGRRGAARDTVGGRDRSKSLRPRHACGRRLAQTEVRRGHRPISAVAELPQRVVAPAIHRTAARQAARVECPRGDFQKRKCPRHPGWCDALVTPAPGRTVDGQATGMTGTGRERLELQ